MIRLPGSVRLRITLAATVLTAFALTLGSMLIVQQVESRLLDSAHAREQGAVEEAGHEGDEESEDQGLSEAAVREVQEGVDAVVSSLLLIVPGLVLLLGAGIWLMVGRALRPVRAISDQVTTITSTTLDERVPQPRSNDEIAELAAVMNEMLDRLERGSERQHEFIADASHELRSPLSTIKAAAEVAQVSPDPNKLGQLAGEVKAEADRMKQLIADLLDLARYDEQLPLGVETTISLTTVSEQSVSRLPTAGIDVGIAANEDIFVVGVESQIERAVFNLLVNAVQHADQHVSLQVLDADGRAQIIVDDDGAGIPPNDSDRIFDRFVRLDQSRVTYSYRSMSLGATRPDS